MNTPNGFAPAPAGSAVVVHKAVPLLNGEDVRSRVSALIAHHIGLSDAPLDNADSITNLGADSLNLVEICMALEDEFGIEIPDREAEALITVGDVIAYVEESITAGRCHKTGASGLP